MLRNLAQPATAFMLSDPRRLALWHPWAIETAIRWLQRTAQHPVPNEQVVRVRRALGWLVVEMSDDKRKAATEGMSFVAGETLYGLSTIPLK
jgi:hypothetical protein